MTSPVWSYGQGITTLDGDLGITLGAMTGGSTPSSSAFPAANDAILVPISIKQNSLVKTVYFVNGGTVSGNIDVGVYTKDGAKITSSGSSLQTGTNTIQFYNMNDQILSPGCYYIAVAMDNNVGTLFRANVSVVNLQGLGLAKQASAFPLPSTITFATVTANYLPLFGIETGDIH